MVLNPTLQERRSFPRSAAIPRVAINLLKPQGLITANSVNFSEGGLCLRLQETLEVRSLVRLQVAPEGKRAVKGPHRVECTGRVTWVIQRLDLRDAPPFLFDVGIEFVDPPPLLRQLVARLGGRLGALKARGVSQKSFDPALIRSQRFVPQLERQAHHPLQWHLVVSVDGVPCFSGHYPSQGAASAAWVRFKRQQAKGRRLGRE